jgi:hypothetical protein
MNEFHKINNILGSHNKLLVTKLDVAIAGLEAIISEGSDNLRIAEKTLDAINDCEKQFPQEQSEKE